MTTLWKKSGYLTLLPSTRPHSKQLGIGGQLPGLPDYDSQIFPDQFIEYCRSSEWEEYWKGTVRRSIDLLFLWTILSLWSVLHVFLVPILSLPSLSSLLPQCTLMQLMTEVSQYSLVLLPWLQKQAVHGQECQLLYHKDEHLRREIVFQDQNIYQVRQFRLIRPLSLQVLYHHTPHTLTHSICYTPSQEEILSKFFELRDQELTRQKSVDSQLRNQLSVTLQRWKGTRRFFMGERGAWSCRYMYVCV